MVRLQTVPIDVARLWNELRADSDGAIAQFLGVVRDSNRGRRVLHLDYEAFTEMAEAEMSRIERETHGRFAISEVALAHRVGRIEIGEVSVAIVVAAPHRAPALEACRFAIEELKRRVPIWKKEVFSDGEIWIEGAGERRVERNPSAAETDPDQA